MPDVKPIPDGYTAITPYLIVENAAGFLVQSVNREIVSWRNGTLDTGKLMMGKRQFKVPSISGMTEY